MVIWITPIPPKLSTWFMFDPETGERIYSSSLIFPLGHIDGWINNARMKARRLYHYIENNWVQSKLMITGKLNPLASQSFELYFTSLFLQNTGTRLFFRGYSLSKKTRPNLWTFSFKTRLLLA